MSDEDSVRELDRARRTAMVDADVPTLQELFHDDMMWVHATARVDTKAGFLEAIGSGSTRYFSIDVTDERFRQFGETALLSGVATMRLEVKGDPRAMENRYTIIWHRTDGYWRVVHWQSTVVPKPA
jgi:ketosteroid isomerase-like protein